MVMGPIRDPRTNSAAPGRHRRAMCGPMHSSRRPDGSPVRPFLRPTRCTPRPQNDTDAFIPYLAPPSLVQGAGLPHFPATSQTSDGIRLRLLARPLAACRFCRPDTGRQSTSTSLPLPLPCPPPPPAAPRPSCHLPSFIPLSAVLADAVGGHGSGCHKAGHGDSFAPPSSTPTMEPASQRLQEAAATNRGRLSVSQGLEYWLFLTLGGLKHTGSHLADSSTPTPT